MSSPWVSAVSKRQATLLLDDIYFHQCCRLLGSLNGHNFKNSNRLLTKLQSESCTFMMLTYPFYQIYGCSQRHHWSNLHSQRLLRSAATSKLTNIIIQVSGSISRAILFTVSSHNLSTSMCLLALRSQQISNLPPAWLCWCSQIGLYEEVEYKIIIN